MVFRLPSNVRAKRSPEREMPSRDRVVGIVCGSDPGPSRPLVHPAREPGSDEPDGPVVERDRGPCAALPMLHEPRNQGTGFGDAIGDRASSPPVYAESWLATDPPTAQGRTRLGHSAHRHDGAAPELDHRVFATHLLPPRHRSGHAPPSSTALVPVPPSVGLCGPGAPAVMASDDRVNVREKEGEGSREGEGVTGRAPLVRPAPCQAVDDRLAACRSRAPPSRRTSSSCEARPMRRVAFVSALPRHVFRLGRSLRG